jgi:putative oxidoreductase
VKKLLLHPWLTVRAQIGLGLVFIVAAVPKIVDPPSFAHMIYNYRLLPGPAVNAFALVMPWIEILTGAALVLGVFVRTAAKVAGLLLLAFIVAIGVNLARNNAVQCGCFDVHAAEKTHGELLGEMRGVVFRDAALGLLVAQILASAGRAEPASSRER